MNLIDVGLKFNSNYTTRNISSIKRNILHHSGTSVLQSVETIHNYHKNTRGYAGIGYHFYVRKDGFIYKGRPIEYVGGHAYGSNYDSIGICAEGNYNEETMPEAQKQAIIELLKYIKDNYGITKTQKHKDVCATTCPGNNYPFDEIINKAFAQSVIVPAVDDKKEIIKTLQTLLNKVYGSGLVVDGIIGDKTNTALRNVALKNYCANDLVGFVQERLIMNGRSVGEQGIDKKYGKDTENAVKKFQKEKGLKEDGIAGINTIKALI